MSEDFEAPGAADPALTAAVAYEPDGSEESGPDGEAWLRIDGVEGFGRGRDSLGHETVVVYVRDAAVGADLPGELDGLAVVVEVVGRIDALGESAPG